VTLDELAFVVRDLDVGRVIEEGEYLAQVQADALPSEHQGPRVDIPVEGQVCVIGYFSDVETPSVIYFLELHQRVGHYGPSYLRLPEDGLLRWCLLHVAAGSVMSV
jgi:hypothetical protein